MNPTRRGGREIVRPQGCPSRTAFGPAALYRLCGHPSHCPSFGRQQWALQAGSQTRMALRLQEPRRSPAPPGPRSQPAAGSRTRMALRQQAPPPTRMALRLQEPRRSPAPTRRGMCEEHRACEPRNASRPSLTSCCEHCLTGWQCQHPRLQPPLRATEPGCWRQVLHPLAPLDRVRD